MGCLLSYSLPIEQMKATLTLDFSDRLNPDEQRELLDESMRRQVPIESILVEALRMRREARRGPTVAAATATAAKAA
ncbi:MAG: hypothetical protein KCHDKBKB_03032 [Elusimicrobia bacterium]|nr:hypothetical protein [Elusimicrobiota bacterium]